MKRAIKRPSLSDKENCPATKRFILPKPDSTNPLSTLSGNGGGVKIVQTGVLASSPLTSSVFDPGIVRPTSSVPRQSSSSTRYASTSPLHRRPISSVLKQSSSSYRFVLLCIFFSASRFDFQQCMRQCRGHLKVAGCCKADFTCYFSSNSTKPASSLVSTTASPLDKRTFLTVPTLSMVSTTTPTLDRRAFSTLQTPNMVSTTTPPLDRRTFSTLKTPKGPTSQFHSTPR